MQYLPLLLCVLVTFYLHLYMFQSIGAKFMLKFRPQAIP